MATISNKWQKKNNTYNTMKIKLIKTINKIIQKKNYIYPYYMYLSLVRTTPTAVWGIYIYPVLLCSMLFSFININVCTNKWWKLFKNALCANSCLLFKPTALLKKKNFTQHSIPGGGKRPPQICMVLSMKSMLNIVAHS